MAGVHEQIMKNSRWYRAWHERESHALIHWLLFLLVIVFAWFSLSGKIYLALEQLSDEGNMVALPGSEVVISLSPQTKSVKIGESFSVDILLNTDEGPIDGVDIYGLHYDPTILKVIDDVAEKSGTQIEAGDIIPYTAANIVDERTGTIKLGQVSSGGKNFTGRGVLATIHFRAIGVGTTYLKFDFQRGSTVDTNAAHRGKDKLATVVDAIYTVTPK